MACPKGRAVHYIFSFAKGAKEKDAISIPHARSQYKTTLQEYIKLNFSFDNKMPE
jgi:hypothetical protein